MNARERVLVLLLRFSVHPDERGAMLHEEIFRRFLRKQSLINIQSLFSCIQGFRGPFSGQLEAMHKFAGEHEP